MKKRMWKQILSMLMVILMIGTMLPISALAADEAPAEESQELIEEPVQEAEIIEEAPAEEEIIEEASEEVPEEISGEAEEASEQAEQVEEAEAAGETEEAEEAAEEETEEATEEATEEITEEAEEGISFYPEETLTLEDRDCNVVVTIPAYAFDRMVDMVVTEIDAETFRAALGLSEDQEVKAAYDITFYDMDGEAVEPLAPITVTFTDLDVAEDEEITVVHVDAEIEEIEAAAENTADTISEDQITEMTSENAEVTVDSEQGTVEVLAESFSAYGALGSTSAPNYAFVYVKLTGDVNSVTGLTDVQHYQGETIVPYFMLKQDYTTADPDDAQKEEIIEDVQKELTGKSDANTRYTKTTNWNKLNDLVKESSEYTVTGNYTSAYGYSANGSSWTEHCIHVYITVDIPYSNTGKDEIGQNGGSDGIPDMYQMVVSFKASNAMDGTVPQSVVLTLPEYVTEENGAQSAIEFEEPTVVRDDIYSEFSGWYENNQYTGETQTGYTFDSIEGESFNYDKGCYEKTFYGKFDREYLAFVYVELTGNVESVENKLDKAQSLENGDLLVPFVMLKNGFSALNPDAEQEQEIKAAVKTEVENTAEKDNDDRYVQATNWDVIKDLVKDSDDYTVTGNQTSATTFIADGGSWTSNCIHVTIKVDVPYTVTFQNENGEILDEQQIVCGETPEYKGETPTKEADEQYTYTFAGWDSELVEVTENVTYTATYTKAEIPEDEPEAEEPKTEEPEVETVKVEEPVVEETKVEEPAVEETKIEEPAAEETETEEPVAEEPAEEQPVEEAAEEPEVELAAESEESYRTISTVIPETTEDVNTTVSTEETIMTTILEDDTPLADGLNTINSFGYIEGYSDGTVRPNASITRAEAATIFYRLLTDEARAQYDSTENSYSDVNAEAWYNEAVSTVSNMGIMEGYEDGSFHPDDAITRAELTKMIVTFFQTEADTTEDAFNDINGHWASSYIDTAAAYNLVNGYEDGSFRPDNAITRAETVTVINKMLGRTDSSEQSTVSFTDNQNTDAWYYGAIQEAATDRTALTEQTEVTSSSDEVSEAGGDSAEEDTQGGSEVSGEIIGD